MDGGGGGGGSLVGGGGGGGGSEGGGGGGAEDDGGSANARNRGDVGVCNVSPFTVRDEEVDVLGFSLNEIAVCLAFSAVGSCVGGAAAVLLGPAPFTCACNDRKRL